MKITYSSFGRRLALVSLGLVALAGLQTRAAAQVSIYNASYDANGNNITGTTPTLSPVTVTGVFTYLTQVSVFITDGSGANGRIFSTSAFAGGAPAVGTQFTVGVTTSVFQGTEELTTPTNLTLTGTTSTVTPNNVTLAQVASTTTFGANPASGTFNAQLTFAPVTFTITPNATGTLSTTSSSTLTDASSGLSVILYRSAAATPYVAGTPYKVTGFEQPFNNLSEIVGVNSFVASAVPEPGTWAALALGAVVVAIVGRRRSAAGLRV